MSTSGYRYRMLVLLVAFGITSQYVTAVAQGLQRGEGPRARSTRSARQPSAFSQQFPQSTALAQSGGGSGSLPDAGEPPSGEPRDMITVVIWELTISDSAGPETDELVGKLIDKANNLPTVVGTADEVRDLVRRLNGASLLRKSRELRLITTDGQSASTQSGADQPSVVATNFTTIGSRRSSRSRSSVEPQTQNSNPTAISTELTSPETVRTNSIQYRQVGTLVQLTPRIDKLGGIQVQLNYNSSDIEPSPDVALTEIPGGKSMMADKIVSGQIQSSVRLKSGTAVVVQAETSRTFDSQAAIGMTRLLILAASVQPVLE